MKKYLLIFSILLALGLSACGGAASDQGGTGTTGTTTGGNGGNTISFYGVEKTTDPVELTLWLPYEEWAYALIEAFTAHHPNVTINYQEMGFTEGRDALTLDGPAGIGADIFAFPHDQFSHALADGQIEPLPAGLQAKWRGELIPTAIGTTEFEGNMHGVPFQVENIALFYNRDLWGPNPPQTWEEILDFSLTYNNPANQDWTMAWDAGTGFFNFHWLSAGGMELFGPNNDDFRNIGFDSPEAARGLEYFVRMRQLFDIPMADINWNTAEERFRLGEIPLSITGPWAISDIRANGVNFGVTRIPTIEGRQPYAFSGVMIAAVSSFSEPRNRPWAYAFIDFMVSEEGATIMYEYRNTMTTRINIDAIPGLRDDPYLMGIAEQSPFTVPMPTIPEVGFMWTPLDELFQFSWDGDMTIAEVQERVMETYRTLLTVAGITPDF